MNTHHLHVDVETKSEVNLITQGAYNYAKHPSTDILCICFAEDDGEVQQWHPGLGLNATFNRLMELLLDPKVIKWAHNASFERLIFEHVVFPQYLGEPHVIQWRCTAVLARSYGLPSALADVAKFIGLPELKLSGGLALIRRMSIPPFEHTPELLGDMIIYCIRDVRVERLIHSALPDSVNWEHYWLNERINDTGLLIDTAFAERAAGYAEVEKEQLRGEFMKLSGFKSPSSPLFTKWLYERLMQHEPSRVVAAWMVTIKEKDGEQVEKISLAKDVVEALLERADLLPQDVAAMLEVKQAYARSSSSKYQTMLLRADPHDQRLRGAYLYLGASKTGRYSSRGLQMHNMPRDTVDDPEQFIVDGEPLTLAVLPALLRPTIYSPARLVCSDWSAIEARCLPWLADAHNRNPRVKQLLQLFADGGDVYVDEAANIFRKPTGAVDKADRQIGKVAILSLGYGGSVGAFSSMAKNYGVVLPQEDVKLIVEAWRSSNPWASAFWRALEDAAKAAVRRPGTIHHAGRVHFVVEGDCLFCTLPSGRRLCYTQPRLEKLDPKYPPSLTALKASVKPASGEDEWPREALWGGLLAENVCQATCADILAEAMLKVDKALQADELRGRALIVGHTHDEILTEADSDVADLALAKQEAIMIIPPDWAPGLPLAVDSWAGGYYRK